MMKILSPLIILLAAITAHAQSPQKVFFGKNGKKCEEKDAYVFQITPDPATLVTPGVPTNDTDTVVTVYFARNNRICKVYACVNGYPRGPYAVYYENSKLKEMGSYEKGMLKGKVTRYYPNGSLQE